MKFLRPLFLSLLPLMVIACASTPVGTTPQEADAMQASHSFQPTIGTAGLYVFKTGIVISALDSFPIHLDGEMVGLVAWNSYLYLALPPGRHTITSGTSQITLNFRAGQNYYIRQKPTINSRGFIVASPLFIESPATGMKEVEQMQSFTYSYL